MPVSLGSKSRFGSGMKIVAMAWAPMFGAANHDDGEPVAGAIRPPPRTMREQARSGRAAAPSTRQLSLWKAP
jgi:hypothetical protein